MACEEGRSEGHIVVEVTHTLLADLRAQLAETDRRSLDRLQQNSLLDAENEGLRERLTKTKARLAQAQPERCSKCGDTFPIHSRTGDRRCPVASLEARVRRLREALERIVASAGDPILIAETALAAPEAG